MTNVGNPTDDRDAAHKKYVDTHSGGGKTSLITVDSNIDMKNQYRIKKLKTPSDDDDAATKKYVDDSKFDDSVFLKLDGTRPMTGNLNMNNKQLLNIPAPTGGNQPTPLSYIDFAYLKVDGSNSMTNNLNMNNKKIINLITPTNNSDGAPKKYVDDALSGQNFSSFLKKDGSNSMTSDLNVGGNKIINLEDPASDSDAVTKKYVDSHLHQTQVQPSHYKDEFAFLMTNPNQWSDEIDNRTSFIPKKIADLSTKRGNFHEYNNKVLYTTILKNFQGGYKYKMGLNFFRLTGGADYTLCLEILNTDYQLWHKTQISVDNTSSQGLQPGNVSVKKLQHRFIDSKDQTQYMYYHRVLINFRKLTTGNKFFIHILVNIPNNGNDLSNVYPLQFSGVFMIAYGIMSRVSNIDPDKVYDYHTAFDIKPTEVKYNVDINANNKKITNIALDKTNNSNAATVGMVKDLFPFTKNHVYRQYFEEFYDFSDANIYGLKSKSSGIVINSILPNISFPGKDINNIRKEGLNISNYNINFNPSGNLSKFTLCMVFYHWDNRDFALFKTDKQSGQTLLSVTFTKAAGYLSLIANSQRDFLNLPRTLNGKKIVLWLTQSDESIVTKVNISNLSSTLSLNTTNNANNEKFIFTSDDGVLNKIMFSKNFYDFDSEQFKKVMIQEKLNGSYVE